MNRILLLSNDSGVKQKNVDFLSQNGFEVIEASDALNGLIIANNNGFEAIIIDEELSDIDGYRASQKIREHSAVPIILLGSETADKIWAAADKLGFDVYLQKPVRPRELTAYIKAILRRTQPQKPDQLHKSVDMHPVADTSLTESVQVQMPHTIKPIKPGNAERPVEVQINPEATDKVARITKPESLTAAEVVYATCIPQETSQGSVPTAQVESIEAIVVNMENQIIKIKKAIVKFGQVHKSIEELKTTIHQQQQGLITLESRLQEINSQLEDISHNPM